MASNPTTSSAANTTSCTRRSGEDTTEAPVTGVPLHFGHLPAFSGQHPPATPSAVQTALYATSGTDYLASQHPPRTTPASMVALSAESAAAPVTNTPRTPISAGEVVRDVALFPLRAVGFTVALPFRALGYARRKAGEALAMDSEGSHAREVRRRENLCVRRGRQYDGSNTSAKDVDSTK